MKAATNGEGEQKEQNKKWQKGGKEEWDKVTERKKLPDIQYLFRWMLHQRTNVKKPVCLSTVFKIKLYLHLSLSMSFPAHIVANATLMENTRILPTFSLQKQIKYILN